MPGCEAQRMRFLFPILFLAVVAKGAERTGQPEIEFLLAAVAKSDCRFIRSGTEYSGREAADHLRLKLSKAGSRVQTAEDFIEGIASKSSLTGRAYQIRLVDGKVVPSGQWFRDALAKRRASAP